MKFKTLLTIIQESNNVVIGYHGSSNDFLSLDPQKEIWFALDKKSHIMDYYHGSRKTLFRAELTLGKMLDLSMYDTDDMIEYDEIRQFLIDCELSDTSVDTWFFTITDNMRSDRIMLTQVLNSIIRHELLPLKMFDSIRIKEYSHDTICMLNHTYIKNITKI